MHYDDHAADHRHHRTAGGRGDAGGPRRPGRCRPGNLCRLRRGHPVPDHERTWLDVWTWDSLQHHAAAVAAAGHMPEAGAAFAYTADVRVELAELLPAEARAD